MKTNFLKKIFMGTMLSVVLVSTPCFAMDQGDVFNELDNIADFIQNLPEEKGMSLWKKVAIAFSIGGSALAGALLVYLSGGQASEGLDPEILSQINELAVEGLNITTGALLGIF